MERSTFSPLFSPLRSRHTFAVDYLRGANGYYLDIPRRNEVKIPGHFEESKHLVAYSLVICL